MRAAAHTSGGVNLPSEVRTRLAADFEREIRPDVVEDMADAASGGGRFAVGGDLSDMGGMDVVFFPDDFTALMMDAMRRSASVSAAKRLLRDNVAAFVEAAAMRAVMEARGALGADIGSETQPGAPGRRFSIVRTQVRPDTADVSRDLRTRRTLANLADTGRMAEVFSARWQGDVPSPLSGMMRMELGPFGPTALMARYGVPATDPASHPERFWARSAVMSRAADSKLTYAELAVAHEVGYSFKVTQGMTGIMAALAFKDGGDPVFGPAARALYLAWTEPVSGAGRGRRTPKAGLVVNVPARPWMGPSLRSTVQEARRLAPEMARAVFGGWVQVARGKVLGEKAGIGIRGARDIRFPVFGRQLSGGMLRSLL